MFKYNLKWVCNSFAPKMIMLMLVLVILKHISFVCVCVHCLSLVSYMCGMK